MPKKLLMNGGSNANWFTIIEDFEDSDFNLDITGDWTRHRPTAGELDNKNWVYKSKSIGNNDESTFTFNINPMGYTKCVLCFSYDVSSENADKLYVYENDDLIKSFYGKYSSYYFHELKDPTKVNKITFTYAKDYSVASGRDNAYVGEIKILYYKADSSFVSKATIYPNLTNITPTNSKWTIYNNALESPYTYNNEETKTRIIVNNPPEDTHFIKIGFTVSSEENCDFGYCRFVNNSNAYLFKVSGERSGEILVPMSDISLLEFGYKKDQSWSDGDDCLIIHKIELGNRE